MRNKLLKDSYTVAAFILVLAFPVSAVSAAEYLGPAYLEPQLSSDGNTLYNTNPVIVWADPNPPSEQVQMPARFDMSTLPETATATFSITYVPGGGTDLWSARCSTFPEGAKAAFNAAATIWGNLLQSSVPITINACWSNLGSSSILGYSGVGLLHKGFTGAPLANTWYVGSLANALYGSDIAPSNFDMHITYNSNFTWYYGTDGVTPAGQYDLMSVVLHEIAHGLNFAGWMSCSGGTGSWGGGTGYPVIYDRFMRDGAGNPLIDTGAYANPSVALGSALTSNSLWFHGTNAMAANSGQRIKMFAPSTWMSGSSYSHLDYNTFAGGENRLMVYAISSGVSTHDPGPVTLGIFEDMGWSVAVSSLLSVSPASRNVVKDAGATTFGVSNTGTGTMPWTAAVTPVSSWLLITSGASGANSGTINCSFTANTGASARTATIRVTATGATGSPVDVTLTQASAQATTPGAPIIGTATAGNAQATVSFAPPASNGGSAIIGYKVTSSPGAKTATGSASPITVQGLTNGAAYTFKVTATNAAGTSLPSASSNSVIPRAAPGAPKIGVATAGNTQVTVKFTPPASNGGSQITGYTVTSTLGGKTATGSISPITVPGLTNGTSYTFKVTATNAAGTSLPSASSNSVTPRAAPGAPTIGTATAGNAQATVKFTPPASNGGSAITSYKVTSNVGAKTATGSASPITITKLTNGAAYTFTVTATNAAGPGSPSSASNSVIPRAAPGAPKIGTATAGNAQAIVKFTPPASDGGSQITGYTVTSTPGGKTATGSVSPITVPGLTNGAAYTFKVTATNAAGISLPSASSNRVTPIAVP